MQQLQISIPKPCHQDWNQMTPEERGRFCSMCQKTVLDFSGKTDDEILDFIKSHRDENLCGRFRNDQLARPIKRIELPLPVYRSQLSFINTFLLALLFCFGTTLFSCNMPAIPPTPTVGEIEIHQQEMQMKNIPDTSFPAPSESVVETQSMITGDIAVDYPEEEEHVKGKFAVHPQVIDLPAVDIIDSMRLISCEFTVGAMVMVQGEFEYSHSDAADSIAVVKVEEISPSVNQETFFSFVYPNPSDGLLNIEFLPDKEQYVQLDLFDAVGNLVRNFIPRQLLQPERQTLKVDVSDQPPGIYLLRISTGDKVKTERVVIAAR